MALPPLPNNMVSIITKPKKKPYTLSDIELFVPPKAFMIQQVKATTPLLTI